MVTRHRPITGVPNSPSSLVGGLDWDGAHPVTPLRGNGDPTNGAAEGWGVFVNTPATSGSFRLLIDGILTAPIAFDATEAEAVAIVAAHPSVGAGNVDNFGDQDGVSLAVDEFLDWRLTGDLGQTHLDVSIGSSTIVPALQFYLDDVVPAAPPAQVGEYYRDDVTGNIWRQAGLDSSLRWTPELWLFRQPTHDYEFDRQMGSAGESSEARSIDGSIHGDTFATLFQGPDLWSAYVRDDGPAVASSISVRPGSLLAQTADADGFGQLFTTPTDAAVVAQQTTGEEALVSVDAGAGAASAQMSVSFGHGTDPRSQWDVAGTGIFGTVFASGAARSYLQLSDSDFLTLLYDPTTGLTRAQVQGTANSLALQKLDSDGQPRAGLSMTDGAVTADTHDVAGVQRVLFYFDDIGNGPRFTVADAGGVRSDSIFGEGFVAIHTSAADGFPSEQFDMASGSVQIRLIDDSVSVRSQFLMRGDGTGAFLSAIDAGGVERSRVTAHEDELRLDHLAAGGGYASKAVLDDTSVLLQANSATPSAYTSLTLGGTAISADTHDAAGQTRSSLILSDDGLARLFSHDAAGGTRAEVRASNVFAYLSATDAAGFLRAEVAAFNDGTGISLVTTNDAGAVRARGTLDETHVGFQASDASGLRAEQLIDFGGSVTSRAYDTAGHVLAQLSLEDGSVLMEQHDATRLRTWWQMAVGTFAVAGIDTSGQERGRVALDGTQVALYFRRADGTSAAEVDLSNDGVQALARDTASVVRGSMTMGATATEFRRNTSAGEYRTHLSAGESYADIAYTEDEILRGTVQASSAGVTALAQDSGGVGRALLDVNATGDIEATARDTGGVTRSRFAVTDAGSAGLFAYSATGVSRAAVSAEGAGAVSLQARDAAALLLTDVRLDDNMTFDVHDTSAIIRAEVQLGIGSFGVNVVDATNAGAGYVYLAENEFFAGIPHAGGWFEHLLDIDPTKAALERRNVGNVVLDRVRVAAATGVTLEHRDAGAVLRSQLTMDDATLNAQLWGSGGATRGRIWLDPTFLSLSHSDVAGSTVTAIVLTDAGTSIDSPIFVPGIPGADPHVAGQLWNSSGTMKISAG